MVFRGANLATFRATFGGVQESSGFRRVHHARTDKRRDCRCTEKRGDCSERNQDRNFVERRNQHLYAHEYQYQRQTDAQVFQTHKQVGKKRVHGAEPQDRKDIGRQYDENICGDREYRWNGIRREDDVAQFYKQERQKQRRREQSRVTANEKLVGVSVDDRNHFPKHSKNGVRLRMKLVRSGQEFQSSEREESPEEISQPIETRQKRRAGRNKHNTKN